MRGIRTSLKVAIDKVAKTGAVAAPCLRGGRVPPEIIITQVQQTIEDMQNAQLTSITPPLDPSLHPSPEKEVPQGAQDRVMTSTAVKIGGRYVIEINRNSHDNKPEQICI